MSKWIPVSERLPVPEDEDFPVVPVLQVLNGDESYIGFFYGSEFLDEEGNPEPRVTHWQPLPAPPTEGS